MGLSIRRRRRDPPPLVCRQAVELLTDWLEGALEPAEAARFEAHLAACDACTAYLAQIRDLLEALGHLPPERLPPAVLDELVGLYRAIRG
ncbi:MAG TPA: zf-HC2 domain-containing protein [Acidimicrobiales bacterium]|nr:zf-HC2 domain-containing protein [Acidimicrobiales bacterium]